MRGTALNLARKNKNDATPIDRPRHWIDFQLRRRPGADYLIDLHDDYLSHHHVGGLNIFYREAGPKDAQTLLLLHGFPSSSRMFDTLIPLLADRYHIIAPDYPSFGQSDTPPPSQYAYTIR